MRELPLLRVHVCIDQEWSDAPQSGLIRTWEQFWSAAMAHPQLELTTHLLGNTRNTTHLSPNVRVEQYPPPRVTSGLVERLGLPIPARVGLFPFRGQLASALRRADLIHTTYTLFSFAMTGLWVAQLRDVPLTSSLQTLVPQHAELYADALIRRRLGPRRTPPGQPVPFAQAVRRALEAQSRWYYARCQRVFISSDENLRSLPREFSPDRVVRWGRGVDHQLFHPRARDRAFLQERFGIARDLPVLLYVGKVRREKNVQLLADSLVRLREQEQRFVLLVCGEGDQESLLRSALGDQVILAGLVRHEELPRIYASSDLLVFPSSTESFGQAVMEARCCGLTPMVSAHGGAPQHVRRSGGDGFIIPHDEPQDWFQALQAVLRAPEQLRQRAAEIRQLALRQYPSWSQLFDQVVLPTWKSVAQQLPSRWPHWAERPPEIA